MKQRAVLIDPELRSIVVLQIDVTLDAIHEQIGPNLDSFALAEFDYSFDHAWVDDMGLTNGPVYAFLLSNRHDPIAGRCLIVGVDRETRDRANALIPIGFLRANIEWLGKIKPEVTWDQNGPVTRSIVTYSKV